VPDDDEGDTATPSETHASDFRVEVEQQQLRASVHFLFDVLVHAESSLRQQGGRTHVPHEGFGHGVRGWIASLKYAVSRNHVIGRWLLRTLAHGLHAHALRKMMLDCPHGTSRKLMAGLLWHTMLELRSVDATRYFDVQRIEDGPAMLAPSPKYSTHFPVSEVVQLTDALMDVLRDADTHILRAGELQWLVRRIAGAGAEERAMLVATDAAQVIVDVATSEHAAYTLNAAGVPETSALPSLLALQSASSLLLRSCQLDEVTAVGPHALDGAPLVLPPALMPKLCDRSFVLAFIMVDQYVAADTLCHLAFGSVERSNAIVGAVVDRTTSVGRGHGSEEVVRSLFHVLNQLLRIDDALTPFRVEQAMRPIFNAVQSLHTTLNHSVDVFLYHAVRLLTAYSISTKAGFASMVPENELWSMWPATLRNAHKERSRMSRESKWADVGNINVGKNFL
jgi:hypothetical protein